MLSCIWEDDIMTEKLENMSIRGKITLFLIVLLIVMLPALYLHTRPVADVFGHDLFKQADGVYHFDGSTVSITETPQGASFEGKVDGTAFRADMTQEGRLVRTTFDDGEVIEGYDNGWIHLQRPDGSLLTRGNEIIFVGEQRTNNVSREEIADNLWQLWQGEERTKGIWWFVLFMALPYLAGMATILWPEEMHFLFSRWRYQNAELSYDGLMMERLGGWVLLLGSVVLMYLPLFT